MQEKIGNLFEKLKPFSGEESEKAFPNVACGKTELNLHIYFTCQNLSIQNVREMNRPQNQDI